MSESEPVGACSHKASGECRSQAKPVAGWGGSKIQIRIAGGVIVAAETERTSHKVYEKDTIGEVQIADEVVAIIAGLAATEVEGVDSMAGNVTNELVSRLGMKNLSKGVKVDVLENVVCVNLNLNLEYGYSIPETCKKVQEKVKTAIENMTGLTVTDVNIRIAGVNMSAGKH